jgi:sugar/nucleoside kinase (ribokinase family)
VTMRYGSWGIIVDDVVFPDGRTAMGQLGGGGLYAAVGMRLWARDAGIIAAVGADFDAGLVAAHGLDASGIFVTGLPTPRAWQLFEEDGTRTQIPRVAHEEWMTQLVVKLSPQSLPPTLEAAHFLARGDTVEADLLEELSQRGVRLSGEPVIDATITEDERNILLRTMHYYTLYSPGETETRLILGTQPVPDLLRRFADYGPEIVALRRGASGSVIYEREKERFWHAPAAPATVVDVTGAGNAYCGGFLMGLVEGVDIARAAAYAAVSAAMTIEQVGPPVITPEVEAQARQRMADALPGVREIDEGELRNDSL